jgi:hypothetical protein
LDDYSDANTINNSSLSIAPNPAQDYFQIHINNEGETLQIFSIEGLLLREQQMNEGTQRVSISLLANGMYLVKLKGKPTNSKLYISR